MRIICRSKKCWYRLANEFNLSCLWLKLVNSLKVVSCYLGLLWQLMNCLPTVVDLLFLYTGGSSC